MATQTFGISEAVKRLDCKQELQYKAADGTWHDVKYDYGSHTFVPGFDVNTIFRHKPTSRVPFEYPIECWSEMLKHEPFGWVVDEDGDRSLITGVSSDNNGYVQIDLGMCLHNPADYMFHYFRFSDGTPFGKIAKG